MMRDETRLLVYRINSYNVWTTYRVKGDQLLVQAPGGLLPEQRELIKANKADILAYLTTPPQEEGDCIRGHKIQWALAEDGCWLCSCYFLPASQTEQKPDTQPAAATKKTFIEYLR